MSAPALEKLDYAVVQQCMHCGMCLPSCPTWRMTQRERNSPRGRIALARAVADRRLEPDSDFAEEFSFCLGCLACQTACPADVQYAPIFEAARAEVQDRGLLSTPATRFYRWISLRVLFRHPRLLRLAGRLTYWTHFLRLDRVLHSSEAVSLFSPRWHRLLGMIPPVEKRFSHQQIRPVEVPAQPRWRVGLLTGCIQDLAFSRINRDTADVLLENGCTVVTPPEQPCCGSLHAHNGETRSAQELARRLLDLFPLDELDAVITNAGGCGNHLRHYADLLAGDVRYAERAREWDCKIRDIHEWLVALPFRPPTAALPAKRVAYHPSCHLHHGQRVRVQPGEILKSIPGLEVVPLTDATVCCGSAGIYSLTHPVESDQLMEDKVCHLLATGADCVATSNPGCDLQLRRGLAAAGGGKEITVTAPVSLLAEAYRREAGGSPKI